MPEGDDVAKVVGEPRLSSYRSSMEMEVRFPRWQMMRFKHTQDDSIHEMSGEFSQVPDGAAASFSGGFSLEDLVMPTLTLDRELGPVTAVDRRATRYSGAWVLYGGGSIAGMAAADRYLVDRDDEWPQLSLRIVGFLGRDEYARIEFERITFL